MINTFKLSFYGNDAETSKFVGLDNYKAIVFETDVDYDIILRTSPKLEGLSAEEKKAMIKEEQGNIHLNEQHELFTKSLKNTLILWIGNFIPQLILSLSLAVWFTDAKLKIPGKGFFKVVMYMPNIITAASIAVPKALRQSPWCLKEWIAPAMHFMP